MLNFGEHLLDFKKFWKKIKSHNISNNKPAFPNLCDFVNNLMTLLNSSANVEHMFSTININKTKIRNSLDSKTIEGILFSKDYLKK